MSKMKVYKEWLCDESNKIVMKPLSFWFEYFELKPIKGDSSKVFWKAEANDKEVKMPYPMLVELNNGYCLTHNGYYAYKDELFFVANADLNYPKLRQAQ